MVRAKRGITPFNLIECINCRIRFNCIYSDFRKTYTESENYYLTADGSDRDVPKIAIFVKAIKKSIAMAISEGLPDSFDMNCDINQDMFIEAFRKGELWPKE